MQRPGDPEKLPTSSSAPQRPYPELSHRAILWSGLVLIVIGASLVTVLLIAFGSGEHSSQLDAIKTAGTVVLGTGGAAALWLTARRQRSAEIALNQKHLDQVAVDRAFALQQQTVEENREHLARVAAATEQDATQRRLSELYLKAVEQLGSDKAAVRHGGLYALERVAQDDPEQQQTVVNVLCAYLRAPYAAPGASSSRRLGVPRPLLRSPHARATAAASAIKTEPAHIVQHDANPQAQHEREVRLTAQRILESHLTLGQDQDRPLRTFWPNINLDLTGAVLSDLNLTDCRLNTARFDHAELSGNSEFRGAQFGGHTGFVGVNFRGTAGFVGASFADNAVFEDAKFMQGAGFVGVKFVGAAGFGAVTFAGYAGFGGAEFAGEARFRSAEFAGDARFEGAKFAKDARFGTVTFAKYAGFEGTKFESEAVFEGATFAKDAVFAGAEFKQDARFENTEFAGTAVFWSAEFEHDARFEGVKFERDSGFTNAEFTGDAVFEGAEFEGNATFLDAEFGSKPTFAAAWAAVAEDLEASHTWPTGWVPADSKPVPRDGKPGLWVPLATTPTPT